MARARVLLVDDNDEFLKASAEVLGPHYEIIGSASNGRAAIDAYHRLRPDLVVLDVSMPVLDGFAAARELKKSDPHVRIVFLSVDHSAEYREAALQTGARGYVAKSEMAEHLLPAVQQALLGD